MYIDITGADLKEAAKIAYDLSVPAGLGYLHFKPEPLSDAEAQQLIDRERPDGHIALSMDYVHGRGCKFTVVRKEGRLYIYANWYDHSEYQTEELLKRLGKTDAPRIASIYE